MAGQGFRVVTAPIATGTAVKTLAQVVAAANHPLLIKRISVTFNGVNLAAEPIDVRFARQSSAGTMTALTVVKSDDSNGDTLAVTAQHTATVEPTTGDIIARKFVHPTSGYEIIYAPGDREGIPVGAGDRLGVIVDAAADVNAIVEIEGYE